MSSASTLSLRRNFSWTFFGNIVYALCLWGILSILTKWGTPAIAGRFALASAIATPVLMFASLHLRSALVSDSESTHTFSDYLAVRLVLLPLAMAAVWVISLGGYENTQVTAIMIFGLGRSVELVSDIFYAVAQKNDRMDLVAISRMIKGVLALLFFGAAFHFTGDLGYALMALVVAWAIPLFAYDIPHAVRLNREVGGPPLRPVLRVTFFRQIVWATLPLGFVILLAQMRQTIPRTLLESAFGEESVGIYAALSYTVIAGSTIVMALGQSSLARLTGHFAANRIESFKRLGYQLAGTGLVLGLVGTFLAWVAGPLFLRWIYGPEYAAHADLLILIMAGGGIFYIATLLGPLSTAMRAFNGLLLVQIVSVLVLIGMAKWLIPAHGMDGAVYAVMVAATVTCIGYIWLIRLGLRRRSGQNIRWADKLFS